MTNRSLRLSGPTLRLLRRTTQGPWRIYAVVASRGPIFRTERTWPLIAGSWRGSLWALGLRVVGWLTAVVMTFCVVGWVATWVT